MEDSTLLRNRIKIAIEDTGSIVVGSSASARIAIGEIVDLRPDIAVIDLQLEQGSGWDVLDQVATHCSNIMVLTNFGSDLFRSEAERRGVTHFFDKTNEFEQFLLTLQKLSDKADKG